MKRESKTFAINIKALFTIIAYGYILSCNAESLLEDDETALLELYGDWEMVSIATGSQQPITKAPAVASVITADTIKKMGATDIDEVLETVPGLHVARDVIGYHPQYIFRGIYGDFNPQVLMLVNGIPITNLFLGDRNLAWGGMPVNAISRIEIIRGPGSAVYGADAFAGVINIITKNAKDINGTEIGARIGSFSTRDAWVLSSAEFNGIETALSIEYHETDGQQEKISSDAQTALDIALGTSASLAPGPVNLSRKNLDIRLEMTKGLWRFRTGLQQRRDFGNGAGIAQALDPVNRYASDRFNVDIGYNNPNWHDHWDISAQLSYFDTSQEIEENLVAFPPGTDLGFGVLPDGLIGNPEVYERHYRFDTSAFYRGIDDHLVRIGSGYFYGDIYKVKESKNFGINPTTGLPIAPGDPIVDVSDTSQIFLPEKKRNNRYLFAQDIWSIANDWELTAGVRIDSYSDFGSTTNPRTALVWSTTSRLTTKLLYGRAFRAPSFAETSNINNPVVLGNPDLDPETIRSSELVFDYKVDTSLRYSLNVFHYVWKDIILFVPNGAGGNTAQNVGKQKGKGLEFELNWRLDNGLTLLGNYAFQKSTNKLSDDDAGRSPQHQI
ncbi:MAG: TonB-dependent receptor, partial [Pseudomonadales bacterium]